VTHAADPRVDAYIDALPDWQQAICREVRTPQAANFSKRRFFRVRRHVAERRIRVKAVVSTRAGRAPAADEEHAPGLKATGRSLAQTMQECPRRSAALDLVRYERARACRLVLLLCGAGRALCGREKEREVVADGRLPQARTAEPRPRSLGEDNAVLA
jgi:hypothetical protein